MLFLFIITEFVNGVCKNINKNKLVELVLHAYGNLEKIRDVIQTSLISITSCTIYTRYKLYLRILSISKKQLINKSWPFNL